MCCENVGTRDAGVIKVQIAPSPLQEDLPPQTVALDGNKGVLWSDSHVAGVRIPLTVLEAKLAWFLLFNAGIIHSYQDIMEHVWEYPRNAMSQVVYTGLSRLSKKSAEAGLERWWRARHGFGYWVDGVLLQHDR